MTPAPIVAVIGPHDATPEQEAAAEALGHALARHGCRVVCGGRRGVMAAVCRGAKAGGGGRDGVTIGLLPGDDPTDANPWVDVAIPTGLGLGRNLLVVRTGAVVVAVGGGAGTLSEIALAWQLGKPIVALEEGGGWSARLAGAALDPLPRAPIQAAATVVDAVTAVLHALAHPPQALAVVPTASDVRQGR